MGSKPLRDAGTLLFVAVGQFLFFFELAEIYYPGYDVSANTISDLGATCGGACRFVQPSSWIFNASIVFLGVVALFVAYYVWKGSGSRLLPLFIALGAAGATGVGVFNESFRGAHVFFSALTFVATGVSLVLVFRVAGTPFSHFSAFLGLVSLGATVLYAGGEYLGLGQGGMERMIVYPALVGLLGLGGYLMGAGDPNPA